MLDDGPQPFPQPTLNTQRALCAIEQLQPEKLSDCFGALYQAFWAEGQAIGKPEVFGPVLAKVLGEDGAKKIVEESKGAEVKKKLSANSDWAMEEGCFGLPWFVATNEKGEWLLYIVSFRELLS